MLRESLDGPEDLPNERRRQVAPGQPLDEASAVEVDILLAMSQRSYRLVDLGGQRVLTVSGRELSDPLQRARAPAADRAQGHPADAALSDLQGDARAPLPGPAVRLPRRPRRSRPQGARSRLLVRPPDRVPGRAAGSDRAADLRYRSHVRGDRPGQGR